MSNLNLLDCVEQGVRTQVESILNEQGIPMEQALSLFFYEIINKKGIPFDIKPPLDITNLTNEQLAFEIENSDKSGTHSWEDVKAELKREYGI